LVDALAPPANLAASGDPLQILREFVVTFIEVDARRHEMARLMNVEASLGGPRLNYLLEQFVTPGHLPAAALASKLEAHGKMRQLPVGTCSS
jgi:hypothetical protein